MNALQNISWLEIVISLADILIVSFLIYRGLLVIKGTRASPMMWGLTLIVALYFLSKVLGLITLEWMLGNFLSSIIIVFLVIFQEEIRRGLTKVGLGWFSRRTGKEFFDRTVENLTLVCSTLAKKKIGALILIQREVGLDDFVEEAVILDANFHRKLLYGIFVKDSPLHDGAVIIEGNRIKAAGCLLPLSFNPDLDPALGTRHRAALGISERSDAVVIVVSEETGRISVVIDGRMTRNVEAAVLRDILIKALGTRASREGVAEEVNEDE